MPKYNLRKRRGKRVALIAIVLAFILLIAVVIVIRNGYYNNLQPVSSSQNNILITVERGSTASEIADSLKQAGLIRQTWAFEWYVRNNNLRGQLQAGTYYFQPNQSIPEIVDILTRGRVATDMFTILPGKRLDQIRASLVNAGFSPNEVEIALDPSQYSGHPAVVDKPVGATLEGYLYPETFQKTPSTKASEIIKASLDEMQKHLTPEVRAAIARQGLTVHEGIILASIVEKEVGVTSDRPTVAQVFLLRLQKGMLLQSDATTSYGAVLDKKTPTPDYDSLFNTYKHKGLPPGPISNVSKSSIIAVAKPATSDYLYFVAGNDCKTRFSKTLAEHEALIGQHGVGCK